MNTDKEQLFIYTVQALMCTIWLTLHVQNISQEHGTFEYVGDFIFFLFVASYVKR